MRIFAQNMAPPPPLLNSSEVQSYSDGHLKWIIEHGLYASGMPAYKGILNDEEMWQTVAYRYTFQPRAASENRRNIPAKL